MLALRQHRLVGEIPSDVPSILELFDLALGSSLDTIGPVSRHSNVVGEADGARAMSTDLVRTWVLRIPVVGAACLEQLEILTVADNAEPVFAPCRGDADDGDGEFNWRAVAGLAAAPPGSLELEKRGQKSAI